MTPERLQWIRDYYLGENSPWAGLDQYDHVEELINEIERLQDANAACKELLVAGGLLFDV